MIRHIVMWKLKESCDGMNKGEMALKLKKEIERLKTAVPSIEEIEAGINFTSRNDAYDLVLNSVFRDEKALEEYQVHPEHEKFKELIARYRESIIVADYIY